MGISASFVADHLVKMWFCDCYLVTLVLDTKERRIVRVPLIVVGYSSFYLLY